MAKAKKFKIGKNSEVYAISLVEMPAIEEDYIYMAKEKPKKVYLESEAKHICLGPVLIPNRPIYRYSEDIGEYYIEFDADVIEKLAYDFLKNRLTNSLTLDHKTDASDLAVVESWIKTTEHDKSNDLGFNLPIGTWFASVKVNNEETWNRIVNEELNGFSVESFVNLDEINIQTQINNMENKSFLQEIKDLIIECFQSFGKVTEEETIVEEEVNVEETVEEVTEEEIVEEVKEEEIVEETVNVEALENEIALLKAKIDELTNVNESLSNQMKVKDEEIEKLSNQPSAKKIEVGLNSNHGNYPTFLDFASGRSWKY